jgi:hypothetical protein
MFAISKGGHDNGYYGSLAALQTLGLKDKLIMLQSYSQVGREINALKLPTLKIPELFLVNKLERYPERRPSFKKARPQSDTITAGVALAGLSVGLGGDSPGPGTSRQKRKNTIDSAKSGKKGSFQQSNLPQSPPHYSAAETVSCHSINIFYLFIPLASVTISC